MLGFLLPNHFLEDTPISCYNNPMNTEDYIIKRCHESDEFLEAYLYGRQKRLDAGDAVEPIPERVKVLLHKA